VTLWVAAAVVWVVLVAALRLGRLWLPFYVLATVGFALLFLVAARGSPVEHALEAATAQHAHEVSGLLGIPTMVFRNAPGTLLVLVVVGRVGWTIIEVGIECSGLLELAAFAGLLLFYPGLRVGRRLTLLAFGLAATYAINILRLLVIIAFLHWGGKDIIFLAHTVIGRGVFFVLVIALYWFVFTRAALQAVRERVAQG
jgi:exosortase family protein XrtG